MTHANLKKQSFDLTFSCMPVNPGVYRHPGKSQHIPACSKMRGNTVYGICIVSRIVILAGNVKGAGSISDSVRPNAR